MSAWPTLPDHIYFTLREACNALAMRGRVEHFDAVKNMFQNTEDYNRQDILSPLALLALAGGPKYMAQMLPVLKPHLAATNLQLGRIVAAVWACDLRELLAAFFFASASDFADHPECVDHMLSVKSWVGQIYPRQRISQLVTVQSH